MKKKNRTAKFKALQLKLDKAKQDMVAEAKIVFNDITKELFEEFPEMNSFSWEQYTPYFNDGDECTFSVKSYSLCINEISNDEISDAITYGRDSYPAQNVELVPASKAVQEFLDAAPEEMMEFVFGDHVTVTIKRDGTIETDECSHD